jgi:hypothetical protein
MIEGVKPYVEIQRTQTVEVRIPVFEILLVATACFVIVILTKKWL